MEVEVNRTRPWFDVDGPELVPDGPEMWVRPTVVESVDFLLPPVSRAQTTLL